MDNGRRTIIFGRRDKGVKGERFPSIGRAFGQDLTGTAFALTPEEGTNLSVQNV
jgi:hypothetical protein